MRFYQVEPGCHIVVLRLEPGSTLRTRLPCVVLLDGTRLPRGSTKLNPASIRGSTKLNPAAIAAIVVLHSCRTRLRKWFYTAEPSCLYQWFAKRNQTAQAELESQGEA